MESCWARTRLHARRRAPDLPRRCRPQRKPWSEVLDRSSFSKPGSIQEAASRLRKNAGYFRINYLIVILLTVAGTFLTHPSSLFVLAFLLASWVYMFAIKQGPLVINGKELRCARAGAARGGRRRCPGGAAAAAAAASHAANAALCCAAAWSALQRA